MAIQRRELLALLVHLRGDGDARRPAPRPFEGAPYRCATDDATPRARPAGRYSTIEAIAWFVAFAAAFVRLLFGLVRPEVALRDTLLACLALATLLLGFTMRSRG